MSTPKRIQLRRTKGWRKPEGAIVVSRPSKWGNPFPLDLYRDDYPNADDYEIRRMATSDYSGWVTGRYEPGPEGDPPTGDQIRAALAGHDLACWCPLEQPCHADLLLKIANAPGVRKDSDQ